MLERSHSFVAAAAFLIIVNVVTTSALKGGYEHVYTYNYAAKINVGVDGHVSEYYIDGLLKIQRDVKTDKYMLALSDLKHNYYHGEDNPARVSESNAIDNNVLQIPFHATYENGLLDYIDESDNEPSWSRKIKWSIAYLLQFDWSIVQKALSNEGRLNENDIEEITAHKKCKVNYKINRMNQHSKSGDKILLMRVYSLNSCEDLTHNFTNDITGYLTNDEFTKKNIEDINKWKDSAIRNAHELDVTDGVPIVKRISNFESYTYSDCTDNIVMKDNRPLIVKIRQNLVFNSTSMDDIQSFKGFEKIEKNDTSSSMYFGNFEKLNTLLMEPLLFMEKSPLDMIKRGAEHRQLFNKILSLLKRCSPAELSLLKTNIIEVPIQKEMRTILSSILPYVGTKPSFDLVLEIISKKLISDDLAIQLLTTLPIYAPLNLKSLEALETFISNNNELQLTPKVYESSVLSFSHLLNRICNRAAGTKDSDRIAERYLPVIVRAFDAAQTTASKLVFQSALGNIRNQATVKYILTTLVYEGRLRLSAINILSKIVSEREFKNLIYKDLIAILKDKSQSRAIRIAAYDVLISKSYYAIDQFAEIGSMISDNKDLYNYHLSMIEGLQQVGILDRHAKSRVDSSGTAVSSTLSKTVILKTDNLLKPELLKSTLKVQSVPETYLKLSIVSGDESTNSKWRIPAMVKFEVLEKKDGKLIVNKAVYYSTNFNGNVDDGVYFDLWTVFNQNTRPYYVDSLEFKNLPNLLDISEIIMKKVHETLAFAYQELTTFSIKTGFGIDAVFEHKFPGLASMLVDYNWNAEEDYLEARVNFSLKSWSNGYSGVSIYNPFAGLTHSIRKTQQLDTTLSLDVIVKYDFSKHEFNLTIPVNPNDPEEKWTGVSIYSSTSVGITDVNDEISCENCGFKVAADHQPPTNMRFRRTDYLGLLASYMTYNCDPDPSLDVHNLLGNADEGKVREINTCGLIAMIRPNTSKPISQIEMLINADVEFSKSMEKPWYFLPGSKFFFESSIGTRQLISNEMKHLLKLDFNMSSSQGHFSNLLQFKVVKRNDENSNFIICFDGKADFPETDDNHMPTEITQSKLNAFSRVVMGQSADDSCSAVKFAVDFDLTGEVSETQKDALENYAENSFCALQKAKWLYVYLNEGSFLLTEACVREMIANTTLRRYKLDLTSEQFTDLSLLQALLIIRSTQDKLKEMAANSHQADVDIKMVSPISEIRTKKQMTFQADYPVPEIYRNLPNIYFSQEFVLDFIDKKINVINVYPEMIVYNNVEKPFDGSEDWSKIDTGVENSPYGIYASVVENKMSLKILYTNYELILKPKLVPAELEKVYDPEIYYNQQLFNDFHKRLHLFSTQAILFSLSRVDHYIVIRSTEIPVTIYYTTKTIDSSINIFQRI